MEGFDPRMMQYGMHMGHDPSGHPMLLPPPMPDQHSPYDPQQQFTSPPLPQPQHHPQTATATPSMHQYNVFDDAFSDVMSAYENASILETTYTTNDNPSLQRDDKLLSFSMPAFNYTLLDFNYQRSSIALNAQLNGMFFMGTGDEPGAPTELTCYRRNLFSITGSISIPRSLRCILTEQGEQVLITHYELALSATESVEGNTIKIISVPWKTPASVPPSAEDKTEKEPSPMPVDLANGAELDPEFATCPIAWKRLQFRIATANNGRRKELQQHFITRLKVMATLENGQRVPLCEVSSNPIIVRGRSPRNFQKKDQAAPGGNGSISAKRPAPPVKQTTNDSNVPQVKTEHDFGFDQHQDVMLSPDIFSTTPTNNLLNNGAPNNNPFGISPPQAAYHNTSPGHIRGSSATKPAPAPINLSLLDEEVKRTSPPGATPTRKAPRLSNAANRPPSMSAIYSSTNGEADESADQLYEYFPLNLDDWQEPVDAVYRPHVVHHIKIPSEYKNPKQNRSKRYFSTES